MSEVYDCVIIGAGQAGMRAADALAVKGLSVCVLEARDRVGGRTCLDETPEGIVVDVGGQWISSIQPLCIEACKEFNLHLHEQYDEGKNVLELCGQRSTYSGNISEVSVFGRPPELDRVTKLLDQMSTEIKVDQPHKAAHAREWDRQSFEDWIVKNVKGEGAQNFLRWFSRVCLAAESYEASLLFFLWWVRSGGGYEPLVNIHGGAQEATVHEGCASIPVRYMEKITGMTPRGSKPRNRVVLSAPVTAVEQLEKLVVISTQGGKKFTGRYVICCTPLQLTTKIQFSPPMPALRQQLCTRVPMGCVIKCITLYEKPVWRDQGYSGEIVSDNGPLCVCYEKCLFDKGFYAIVGLVGGTQARSWSQRPQAELQRAVTEQLARCFDNPQMLRPKHFICKDWTQEEWSGGCYMNVFPTGAIEDFAAQLRQPHGRVHWAGTESADVWIGYIEGAMQSGIRAAKEVEARLQQDDGKMARL